MGSLKKRDALLILTACLSIISILFTGCAARQDGPIEWQETVILDEQEYQLISVKDDLKDGERLSNIGYCDGNIYYFKERTIDSMQQYPEYYTLKCMDVETGKTEILYEAPKYHVLEDLIAAEDRLYWVETMTVDGVPKWEFSSYELETGEITVLREGISEDTSWDPIPMLCGRYILWDEHGIDGSYHYFLYSLDDKKIVKEQELDEAISDSYIGAQVYQDALVYWVKKENIYSIRSQNRVFCETEAESVRICNITNQGILWAEGGLGSKVWFIRMKNGQVIGEKEMIPCDDMFYAMLCREWIAMADDVGVARKRRYYLMNVNTGEKYRLPVEGSMFPKCSADGVLYFAGDSESHGDCILIPKLQ